MTSDEKIDLVNEYAEQLRHLIPLASKAYGSRSQHTPEHNASRVYTRLLCDFSERGGSLLELSKRLGVAYSGLRRRVVTASIPARPAKYRRTMVSSQSIESVIEEIKIAKKSGPEEYHRALHSAYHSGFSLSKIAKGLGLSNTYPLYYGVQRHELREQSK